MTASKPADCLKIHKISSIQDNFNTTKNIQLYRYSVLHPQRPTIVYEYGL